ncbi:MAG: S-layer homology domain-containing protein [Anaerolineales bacterium]|nr:S-layer homology domain-containing protein [Anaerolineales bacterium]
MFSKKPILKNFFILFMIILLLTGVTPVKADALPAPLSFIDYTFTVNSTLDLPDDLTQPGTCHTAANTCTLRAAIMQANRAGFIVSSVTINVPSGHYVLTPPASPADGDESGDLNLTTPTISPTVYHIIGAGAATTIIDANSYDRVLHVHSGRSVDITGVTIQNGYLLTGINSGCGIYNEGFLNLSDVVITNNHCAGYGGGIYNANQLGISDSTINLNTSSLGGGGIDESGSYLSIENSTISGNSSTGSNGGGILSGGTEIKISNSTISNNSAYGSGGGIYNASQNLIIINSTLIGNQAFLNGGAIFNKNTGQINVYNSTIVGNIADSDADINGGQAGGVYNIGTFNMRNTLLAGNSVSGAPVYDDCSGTISSYGRNLIGAPYDDTSGSCTVYTGTGTWAQLNDLNLLGILQDNGGPTKTVALLKGSNAIDGADPVFGCTDSSGVAISKDQRGLPRTAGVRCDIGAYEFSDYTPPTVSSIVRVNPNPTNLASVNFTVNFSETVTGVNAGDFSLWTSGVSGAAVSGVSGSGSSYTVSINTGTGNGTIRLDVVSDGSIKDSVLNPLVADFTSGEAYTVSKTVTFGDVPLNYWANTYIETLYNAGITGGCSTVPLNYCPDSTVTRAQMAVFLLKSMHGSSFAPPAVGASTGFTDVPTNYWAAAWIKQLAAEGITSGCGANVYCPDATVTRAQMAIFLLKAKHGVAYIPPNATGVFSDVPVGYWADKWIERLAYEGVTSGCSAGLYCPDAAVTRAQMAVFLVKIFNLPFGINL